jgi:hypothetical protein
MYKYGALGRATVRCGPLTKLKTYQKKKAVGIEIKLKKKKRN